MKILITGSEGFIGSHLAEKLKWHQVIAWTREPKNPNELEEVSWGDLADPFVESVLPDDLDLIIHLAAYNSTKDFYTDGLNVIRENILPTLNLLEYYKNDKKPPIFMYAGTPEIYSAMTDNEYWRIPTDESCPFMVDLEEPRWSYASSKALGEQAVRASGLPHIIFRPNNIYGPRQKNHFVDEFIGRAKGGEYTLHGWENTRSWLYVDDLCDAIYSIIINRTFCLGQTFNIGSNEETQVLDVANRILLEMGSPHAEAIIDCRDAPSGSAKRRMPDIDKIKQYTGWEPKTSLEDGIKKTVRSYMI